VLSVSVSPNASSAVSAVAGMPVDVRVSITLPIAGTVPLEGITVNGELVPLPSVAVHA